MLEHHINSLKVRNYRSLADIDLQLEDLTVLVGANGSGKSNILDVLRFLRDALTRGIDAAISERGGFHSLIYQNATEIEFQLSLRLDGETASYQLILESAENDYQIQLEHIIYKDFWLTVRLVNGESVVTSTKALNPVENETSLPLQTLAKNLLLPLISSMQETKLLYDFLSKMGFYNIFPDQFRSPQTLKIPYPMRDTGENTLSTLQEIIKKYPRNAEAIYAALSRIVPSIVEENPIRIHPLAKHLIAEIQHEKGLFELSQESDGTVRALALLTALYQEPFLSLIGIEEPEMMLHIYALAVLCDVLKETALRSQVIVTTHSSDMISHFAPESLRVVEKLDGKTQVGAISQADFETIQERLMSGGELLRMGALNRA